MKVICIKADNSSCRKEDGNQLEYLKIYNVLDEGDFLYKIDLENGKSDLFLKTRFKKVED